MQPQLTEQLLDDVKSYVDARYTPSSDCVAAGSASPEGLELDAAAPAAVLGGFFEDAFERADTLDELLERKEEGFSEALLREIDARQLSDPDVYKRANIDRKLFSKIRSNPRYQPSKGTAVALALALHMGLDDTLDLIGRAGYTLTTSSVADIIVMYFVERQCFDLNLLNQALYKFDQPLLGR